MKSKLIKVLLEGDEEKDLLDELKRLMDEFPKESKQYKVLCNLYAYLEHVTDNEVDMIQDLEDSPAPMMAASLRAMGLIGDTARDENIASLILQSADMAWAVNREMTKAILN